jgi:hypothetical protein
VDHDNITDIATYLSAHAVELGSRILETYADDLFNIFYRMEPHVMVREGFAYGGQGRRDFQEQYGVLETIEKVEETDNACSRATKKTVRVLRKPGASPMLFGKFLMTTTAFLSLEDISDNLPTYDESVISVDMDAAMQKAYEKLEEDIRSAMKAHRGNKTDEHPAQHAPALSRSSLRLRSDLGAGLRSANEGVCEVPGD